MIPKEERTRMRTEAAAYSHCSDERGHLSGSLTRCLAELEDAEALEVKLRNACRLAQESCERRGKRIAELEAERAIDPPIKVTRVL